MNSITLAVLVSLCAIATAKFSCGKDLALSEFAELIAKNDCKGRLVKMDKCCKNYTKCYMQGRPQASCDNNFCNCATKYAARGSPACTNQANTFCTTAKSFGGLIYNRLKEEGKKIGRH